MKQVNYEFDSTTYKYSFDTNLEFIVEKVPALFNTNSIEFDASANDGSFLMQVIIEDLDNVYLDENVFLRDENNNVYEREYIESLSKTGTNNYTFRFSVEEFGTYIFNGISFDGIKFQEFENTKVVISSGKINFIWLMMLLLILISLLLASILFVVFNHRNKKWRNYL